MRTISWECLFNAGSGGMYARVSVSLMQEAVVRVSVSLMQELWYVCTSKCFFNAGSCGMYARVSVSLMQEAVVCMHE